MKFTAVLVAVVLAIAGARAAEPGQTTLQPAAAQTGHAQGTTVLHANGAAGAPAPGPSFHAVKIAGAEACSACGTPECGCHKEAEFVSPELKCETEPCSTHPDTHPASCGCLHLETCPCKKEFTAPEIAAPHHAPEVVEQLPHKSCGCEGCHPCPEETHVQPEIKEEPKCGCTGCDPCETLKNNAGQGTTVLHPTTTNAAPAAAPAQSS